MTERNKNYKLFDYESGEYCEVTKEQFEAHKEWMDKFKAILQSKDGKKVGKIMITSTSAEDGDNGFYKNIYNNTHAKKL